jgi:hypothetical protein
LKSIFGITWDGQRGGVLKGECKVYALDLDEEKKEWKFIIDVTEKWNPESIVCPAPVQQQANFKQIDESAELIMLASM